MSEFINKNKNIVYIVLLVLLSVLFLFVGLGSFPLIDVDETRYATMARDMLLTGNWNDLMLNGVPFLEKPPLYFWLVALSVKFFGNFTPFAVRFPIALMSFVLVMLTYFLGKKVISEKFGFYSATVLLASFLFLMLSHIAILDSLLMVFIAFALYSGFMVTICSKNMQKWFWLAFYLSVGIGVLAKGILAVGIPCVILFIYFVITKNLKLLLHPIHLIGILLFFAIVTPWHYLMHKNYGGYFWIEYFVRHHFARFLNSETIGRERPFLYFVPVFLAGFMPWTLLSFDLFVDGVKKGYNKIKSGFVLNNDAERLVFFSALSFCFIFLLFSVASTKLPTYILPSFPFISILMGYYWYRADEYREHEKPLRVLTLALAFVFVLLSVVGSVVCLFLPAEYLSYIEKIQVLVLLGFALCGMLLTLRAYGHRIMSLFATYLIIMLFITMTTVTRVTNILYMSGENELVNYSSISATLPKSKLITFDFPVKPSIKVNYTDDADFITDMNFTKLDVLLEFYRDNNVFVIVKNKNIKNNSGYAEMLDKRLNLLHKGYKYSLYVKP